MASIIAQHFQRGLYGEASLVTGQGRPVVITVSKRYNAASDNKTFSYPLEGKAAPELKIDHWLNSEPLTLKSLRGKVVILDFWSITCLPCYSWFPVLNDIHEKYGDKGIVVIGLHIPAHRTKYAEIRQVMEKEGIKYPVGIATRGKSGGIFGITFKNFSVRGIPTILFIDKNGILRSFVPMGHSLEAKALELSMENSF